MSIYSTHTLMCIRINRKESGDYILTSDAERAAILSAKSGKPVAIVSPDSKIFYTFTVIEAGDKFSRVELKVVEQ